jgi:hypothetical protein
MLPVMVALAIGAMPVAPPAHVHETEDHGHEHLLIHRHLAAHTARHHLDGRDRVFDEHDGPILTFDTVYTVPASTTVLSAPPASIFAFVEPPAVRPVSRWRNDLEYLIHGPPRAPTGLRAPPISSRL